MHYILIFIFFVTIINVHRSIDRTTTTSFCRLARCLQLWISYKSKRTSRLASCHLERCSLRPTFWYRFKVRRRRREREEGRTVGRRQCVWGAVGDIRFRMGAIGSVAEAVGLWGEAWEQRGNARERNAEKNLQFAAAIRSNSQRLRSGSEASAAVAVRA